jgi:hypothetical protein
LTAASVHVIPLPFSVQCADQRLAKREPFRFVQMVLLSQV